MKAGKVLKYFIKLAISGILALIILSVFCLIYFNPPMPTAQSEEYSNTKYIENRFWISLREGFGFGRTNELGYNDTPIRDESAMRIAFIGSSHTVGLQMNQKDIYPVVIEELLFADDIAENDFECISVASAGQFLNTSISNLEPLAKSFDNLAYVVLETPELSYSEEEFEKMLLGEYHAAPEDDGFIYRAAQRIPYLRLIANQYQSMREQQIANSIARSTTPSEPDYEAYERGFSAVAKKLGSIADEYGFTLIFLHHSIPTPDADHTFHSGHNSKNLEILQRCCSENGIILLDMCREFSDFHNSTSISPYGFANTCPGLGHLNANGHSIIAQKIYETVSQLGEVQ